VLRVRTIYAGSAVAAANYYTRYLTDSPGEVPGVWSGAQAAELGLSGDVDGADLLALLEGRDPISGTRLGRAFQDRYLANGKLVRAVAGFDLTFSAPKSVSALWALTQDERILVAHDRAVAVAVGHGERFGSTTRVRAGTGNARLHPDTHGLMVASFRQTTSRSDDPQLHTHAVISSKVETDDLHWLALDARYLKQHQRHIGGLYQSVLRAELSHELGVAWTPITEGQAEIVGVPVELRELFSKRSEEIEVAIRAKVAEFRERQGRGPNQWELGAIKREAAGDTRGPKSGNGVPELVTRWAAEAASIGWTGPDLAASIADAARERLPEPATVDVDGIIAALSRSGSTWSRPQIMSTLCDVARPQPPLTGERWAAMIERLTDEIIVRCVNLDPADAAAPRRRSDGRSLWLEPISPHITTDRILREEELVLSWALDAQADDPTESTTINAIGLDITQAHAASAAAGDGRLVIIVGPAGAGKTNLLRAAAEDLTQLGHDVLGLAPSARAARQLEHDTGVRSDTLAKLLHEWSRTDRGPLPEYAPAPGATLILDEAGMASTPDLAQLVTLADRQQWRLVLVGDFAQLQAVGRGGLFAELCATGRVHELERIYRFREPWEAAASLQLRHGDPSGFDEYFTHGRVIAGTLQDHLATMTDRWFEVTARGASVALVASSNDHVDQINAAIQHARIERGDLDLERMTPVGGDEHTGVGDIIVTRRNDRHITTDEGQPIRNRERWQVTDVGTDGALTVSSTNGHGIAVLPAEYVREYVRLGYAATEHGYQGETTTIGVELVTDATRRRGLYVGATRGTDENLILVVTDAYDLDEARDTLDRILTTDRVDLPAVTQRRTLAEIDRTPAQRRLEPRTAVPAWFDGLQADLRAALGVAEQNARQAEAERDAFAARLVEAKRELVGAERRLDPFRPELDAATADARTTQERLWAANNRAFRAAGWLERRSAGREIESAKRDRSVAAAREEQARQAAAPARDAVNEAAAKVRDLRLSIEMTEILNKWGDTPGRAAELRQLLGALDDWRSWANGKHLSDQHVIDIVTTLRSEAAVERPGCELLAADVERWNGARGQPLALDPRPHLPVLDVGPEL
jgi:conjugative relaxase-like TrwC/TraI family protein